MFDIESFRFCNVKIFIVDQVHGQGGGCRLPQVGLNEFFDRTDLIAKDIPGNSPHARSLVFAGQVFQIVNHQQDARPQFSARPLELGHIGNPYQIPFELLGVFGVFVHGQDFIREQLHFVALGILGKHLATPSFELNVSVHGIRPLRIPFPTAPKLHPSPGRHASTHRTCLCLALALAAIPRLLEAAVAA